MSIRGVAACAEFPNDNPALHRGSIWRCVDLLGAPVCERAEPAQEEPTIDPAPLALELEDAAQTSLPVAPEDPIESQPTEAAPTEKDADDIEIVDDLPNYDPVDESIPPPPPPPADDPFASLVSVLEDVARSAGAPDASLSTLRVLLGRERLPPGSPADHALVRAQAAAWQAVLRGDSEDFSACGSATLDEWSSLVVARSLGDPSRADGLRREIRRRGVAAFGLIVEAA